MCVCVSLFALIFHAGNKGIHETPPIVSPCARVNDAFSSNAGHQNPRCPRKEPKSRRWCEWKASSREISLTNRADFDSSLALSFSLFSEEGESESDYHVFLVFFSLPTSSSLQSKVSLSSPCCQTLSDLIVSFSEAESHQEEEGKGSASRACIVLFPAVSAVSDKSGRLAECVFRLVSLSECVSSERRRNNGGRVGTYRRPDGTQKRFRASDAVVTQKVSEACRINIFIIFILFSLQSFIYSEFPYCFLWLHYMSYLFHSTLTWCSTSYICAGRQWLISYFN